MQRFVMVVIIWLSSVLLYPQLGKTADESLPCTPDMHLLYGDTVICDIRPTGDSASFVFNAEPGDSILLQTTRLSGSLRPCLTLITPDNTHQDACNNAAMNRLQTTLQKGGEYVVRVEDGFIHGTGDFTLTLERTFPPPPSATPMQYGDIKTDAIVPRGAIKVFVFRGMSGDTILLQATRLNGSLRPCLTLIAPDNTRQDVCNNSARNRLESTLEQAGDYTVVIADGFIYGTGDFELSLACLVGSCVPGPPGHGESDNRPPVANAGSDQSVTTGALVTLDGSGSHDDDGDTLTYNWVLVSIPDGSTATLSDPTSEAPTLLTDVDGAYVIHLIVNDGKIDSAPDTVTIFARISPSVIYMLYGINFGPYIDGQDPNRGAVVSEEQLQERMEVIAPYTEWIRCFGSSNVSKNVVWLLTAWGLRQQLAHGSVGI